MRRVQFLDGPLRGQVHETDDAEYQICAANPADFPLDPYAAPRYAESEGRTVMYTVRRVRREDGRRWRNGYPEPVVVAEAWCAAVNWPEVPQEMLNEAVAGPASHPPHVAERRHPLWLATEPPGYREWVDVYGRDMPPRPRYRPDVDHTADFMPPGHWCGAKGCWYVQEGFKRCEPGECVQAGRGYTRHEGGL